MNTKTARFFLSVALVIVIAGAASLALLGVRPAMASLASREGVKIDMVASPWSLVQLAPQDSFAGRAADRGEVRMGGGRLGIDPGAPSSVHQGGGRLGIDPGSPMANMHLGGGIAGVDPNAPSQGSW